MKDFVEHLIGDREPLPERCLHPGEATADLWHDEARKSQLIKDIGAKLEQDGGFEQLSQLLGHDPDWQDEDGEGGDSLSAEDLRDDPGWTYDCIKSAFRDQPDGSDKDAIGILKWLGWQVAE